MLHLTHHVLRVPRIERALKFYREQLGMTAVEIHAEDERRWLLSFNDRSDGEGPRDACLELWPSSNGDDVYVPRDDDAYWKFALTLPDVDEATRRLRAGGVQVGAPRQVLEVAYLCHLADPSGYTVELVQHDFEKNFEPRPADARYALGQRTRLGLSTLRIRDPEISLAFYRDVLGMRLLSRQEVAPAGFTLYFLACTDETPPQPDIDAVANREWLWRRPYTCLELQHRWRGAPDAYRHTPPDAAIGFWGLGFVADDLEVINERLDAAGIDHEKGHDRVFDAATTTLRDPDGFRLRICSSVTLSKER